MTSAQIAVTIIGDDEIEPNEDFLVLLTRAKGAVITGPIGRVCDNECVKPPFTSAFLVKEMAEIL